MSKKKTNKKSAESPYAAYWPKRVKVTGTTVESGIEYMFKTDAVAIQDVLSVECDGETGRGYINVHSHEDGRIVRSVPVRPPRVERG